MDYDFSKPIHYCASVLVIQDNKVLFLKQEKSNYLLTPGGHVEEGELPQEAAVRETLEETGLQIELLEKPDEKARTQIAEPLPMPLAIRLVPCRDKKDIDFIYTAKVIGGELKINEESTEAKWLSRQEIQDSQEVGPNLKYYTLKILENGGELMPKKVDCASFILIKEGNFLVEKRAMTKEVDPGALEIPGGHFEAGETAEQALLREIKEELDITPTKYKHLCDIVYEHPKETQTCHYFVITEWTGEIKKLEAESLQWLDFNETGKIDIKPDRQAVEKYINGLK